MGQHTSKSGGGAGVTEAQNKTLARIARQTRDLKNEQYRIINEDGEVVAVSKGTAHEVGLTRGEKRDKLPGAVSIHNHPAGGPFSSEDLDEFGMGARAMVVSGPDGVYRLTNTKYGTRDAHSGWYDMREAMEKAGIFEERGALYYRRKAEQSPKIKRMAAAREKLAAEWVRAREAGKPLDALNERMGKMQEEYRAALRAEERRLEVQPYHDFYRKNARRYGFKYEFTPRK